MSLQTVTIVKIYALLAVDLLSSVCATPEGASSFRSTVNPALASTGLPDDALQRELVAGIEAALGISHGSYIEEILPGIEALLSPVFAASPKNEYGRVDDGAGRYVLHRLFMERHGWEIRGYDSDDESHKTKSSLYDFGEHVPAEVGMLLDKHANGRGRSSAELALFAATLEYLLRGEIPGKVARVYDLKHHQMGGHYVDGFVTKAQADDLVDMYMTAYLSAVDLYTLSHSRAFGLQMGMTNSYQDWHGARKFFRGIEESNFPGKKDFSFSDLVDVVTAIEKNFVYFNGQQCELLKQLLVGMEVSESGRVPLVDFYGSALRADADEVGTSAFVESVEYLSQLGALDQSNPLKPSVIISNYVDGPSNCVARHGLYSVCCMDECADLYSHIEQALRKPKATPDEIIPVIEGLAPASMMQCLTLSHTLTHRLKQIADEEGLVTLHGKEFAEWMHFVYPRECTYAKAFGPAHWSTVEEWVAQTHMSEAASRDELQATVQNMWSMERAGAIGKDEGNGTAKVTWDIAVAAGWPAIDEAKSHKREFKAEAEWRPVPTVLGLVSLVLLLMKLAYAQDSGSKKKNDDWALIQDDDWALLCNSP